MTVSGSTLGAGSFTITAEYSDAAGNFNNSTNAVTQVVNNPAPAPRACKISITTPQAGRVPASLTGTPSHSYVLQASTDMVHWTAISTNVTDVNGSMSVTDTDAGKFPSRFYRAAALP